MSLFAHILRCVVTDCMLIVFLYTISQPKYKKPLIYVIPMILFAAMNIGTNIYFYLQSDYESAFIVDIITLFILGLIIKPLFNGTIIRWLFGIVTMLNLYTVIVFLSYSLCDFLPYPHYSSILLRFVMFAAAIALFYRFVRPLYFKIKDYWSLQLILSSIFFICFIYSFLYSNHPKSAFEVNQIPLLFQSVLGIAIYVAIFYSLKNLTERYELREESIKATAQGSLLQAEMQLYDKYIDIAKQSRHDLRHHNSVIAGYINNGDVNGAMAYLHQYNDSVTDGALKLYCENITANAVFSMYDRRAKVQNIDIAFCVSIPKSLPMIAPEITAVFSNVLDNACEACLASKATERFITVSASVDDGKLCIEICNSVDRIVEFENYFPKTTKDGGGTGLKSVARIVEKYGGMLRLTQEGCVFNVQIILPI